MQSKQFVLAVLLLVSFVASLPLRGQAPASRLVATPIDKNKLVRMGASVHPLARAQYDQGPVPDSMPAERILLLLNRPAEREQALQQFLRDIHNRESASYHKWITPEEFGTRFGAADADIQAATRWLQTEGFKVARVAKSRQFIEFSGSVGQLRQALHTDIHRYQINGARHYANATDLSIPAGLATLVRGVTPLNDFYAKPLVKTAGPALYSRKTRRATPQWTINNPFGTANPYAYPVAPEDYATQYDLTPLFQAGINGAGETIGIVNESNINLSLVNAYQQMFGLPSNPTQVVIDGNDPGELDNIDVEAYLDVEMAGALAPNAAVNLYISSGSDFQDPLALAAIRAIEDNQASVLSVSFGECEEFLRNAGNQFWSGLWEQAAAQGQTVLVATGDSGPECDYGLGVSVSGLSSTPWNVAVGGTDFYYSDYAAGGASVTSFWNQNNDSSLGSLKASLTEQAWDDPFGLNVIADGLARGEIGAGGGGASACITVDPNTGCVSGYAKPAWQMGSGVPADGVRDEPDVSLYASNGANLSAIPICAFPGDCDSVSATPQVLLVGGTSGSAPAMAGIMALVDQKNGRQGQADYTLYQLAQQAPAAFHDVTLGNNNAVCFTGSVECVVNASGNNQTSVYSAGPGYDLATGLGSVDANLLVNDWNSVALQATTTKLKLSSAKITHGTPVTVTTSVSSRSGSGVPTGAVAILTSSTLPDSQAQASATLSGGKGSASVNFFPGGYYNVTATYPGDGIFGGSTSSPVPLDVTPEDANIHFAAVNGQTATALANGDSIQYNTPLFVSIQPIGKSAPAGKTNGNATGTATFTVDSTTATVALNGAGVASWNPPALGIGKHNASASYSGDASFNATASKSISFNVTQGSPLVNDYIQLPAAPGGIPAYQMDSGGSVTVTILVGPINGRLFGLAAPLGTATPTGTVTVCLDLGEAVCNQPSYTQTVSLTPAAGTNAQYATATATFTNVAPGQFGEYFLGAQYNGDANWQGGGFTDLRTINVSSTASTLAQSTTTLSVTPANLTSNGLATLTITVAGSAGTTPSGEVDFYDNGVFLTYVFFGSNSGTTSTGSFRLRSSSFFNNGANQITAIYNGDGGYQPSMSNVVNLTVAQSGADFTLAPQAPQVTVKAGSSGNVALNLASVNNFSGSVALACLPSSSQITCNLNPTAVNVNGSTTAALTITAAAQNSMLPANANPARKFGWVLASSFMFGSVFLVGACDRKRRIVAIAAVAIFVTTLIAAGCGGGTSSPPVQQQLPPPPSARSYTVLVTANGNGVIHNTKILVMVQ